LKAAWLLVAAALSLPLAAQRVADVRNTPHNLSTSGAGAVHAGPGGTDEVCVFCHTPHQARLTDDAGQALQAPLWNRRVPAGSTYTAYTSSTLDAQSISDGFNNQPGGSSKLCLSCHDGTLAIGNVAVLGGATNVGIPMQGTAAGGGMPAGEGTASGFTRNLGTDLRNDHPISVTFNAALVARDGELRPVDGNQRWPSDGSVVGLRAPGVKPLLPLQPTGAGGLGQVQCTSCHDPHLRELDASKGNQKFLRAQRFQEASPAVGYNPTGDIICLGCHDKDTGFGLWSYTAHAKPIRRRRDLQERGGGAAPVSRRSAGVEGQLPELPRHACGEWHAPADARRHRWRFQRRQPPRCAPRRRCSLGEHLLPVPHGQRQAGAEQRGRGAQYRSRVRPPRPHAHHQRRPGDR
jgi:hypothetical protein